MTTLVSKDARDSLSSPLKGFKLTDGDMLLVGNIKELTKACEWIESKGISSLYFNPEGEDHPYSEFMEVTDSELSDAPKLIALRLYN